MFLREQAKKLRGEKPVLPEGKPKPPKRNISKEKRERMINYGYKVTGKRPINFNIKKKQTGHVDPEDFKNKSCRERSEFGKLVAFK